jgi:hypothetical protein
MEKLLVMELQARLPRTATPHSAGAAASFGHHGGSKGGIAENEPMYATPHLQAHKPPLVVHQPQQMEAIDRRSQEAQIVDGK